MIDQHLKAIERVLEENCVASPTWQLGYPLLAIIKEQQARIETLEAALKEQPQPRKPSEIFKGVVLPAADSPKHIF